jgi:hypothetical protein
LRSQLKVITIEKIDSIILDEASLMMRSDAQLCGVDAKFSRACAVLSRAVKILTVFFDPS